MPAILIMICLALAAIGNTAPNKVLLVAESPKVAKVSGATVTVCFFFSKTPMALTETLFKDTQHQTDCFYLMP